MAEKLQAGAAQIRRCETGGTEIWVWGDKKDGECWSQGWRSPKPVTKWWATKAEEWTLIGHKLMDVDTETAKKSFWVDPNGYRFVDADGYESILCHSRLSSEPHSEGGKGPNFVKIPNAGKGLDDRIEPHPHPKDDRIAPHQEPKKKKKRGEKPTWSDSETWGDDRWSTWSSSSEVKPNRLAMPKPKPKPQHHLMEEVVAEEPPNRRPAIGERRHAIGVRPPS